MKRDEEMRALEAVLIIQASIILFLYLECFQVFWFVYVRL